MNTHVRTRYIRTGLRFALFAGLIVSLIGTYAVEVNSYRQRIALLETSMMQLQGFRERMEDQAMNRLRLQEFQRGPYAGQDLLIERPSRAGVADPFVTRAAKTGALYENEV